MTLRRWLPGTADLLCAALALPFLVTGSMYTLDTWWHIELGEAIVEARAMPSPDPLSYTADAGAPVTNAWGADVVFHALDAAGGLGLLEVAGLLVVVLTFRVVFATARALGASALGASVAVFCFAEQSFSLLILRPQLFTFLFFGLLFLGYVAYRDGRSRWLLASPLLFVVWNNLHGGFLLGIVFLVGVGALEGLEARRPTGRALVLVGLGLAGALASAVHPAGPGRFVDAMAYTPMADSIHASIDEWRQPDLRLVPLLEPAILAALALALVRPVRPRLFELAGLIGTAHLSLTVWRHVPFFGLVGMPILAAWAARGLSGVRLPDLARRVHLRLEGLAGAGSGGPGGWLLLIVLGLAAGGLELARPRDPMPALAGRYPVEAAGWIEEREPAGPVFNTYEWGGFLAYRLDRRVPVYIDSRMTPFHGVGEEYRAIKLGEPGWAERLETRGVEWIVLPAAARLVGLLRLEPRWAVAHEDPTAVVFVRVGGVNDRLVAGGAGSTMIGR